MALIYASWATLPGVCSREEESAGEPKEYPEKRIQRVNASLRDKLLMGELQVQEAG